MPCDVTGVGVGEAPGVGVGEAAVDGDEPPTPPQPTVKARKKRLKKDNNTRLKVLAPQIL
jgi:hypothetical protein